MGYRSNIHFKTTTEGYLIMKQLNDSIKAEEERPFRYAEIQRTPTGFYRLNFEDVKWYDTYPEVINFNKGLRTLEAQNIPYSFIELGEDTTDIKHHVNYTDDMPDEIVTFEPVVDVNDEDWSSYEDITEDE